MPITPTYPGVYIEEIPSGVRTITGVSTSITAFVGPAKRGPTDQAVNILSYADFERRYGGLLAASDMTYAVRQFFLNGGSNAWVIRVAINAHAASHTFQDGGNQDVLLITALDAGSSGNDITVQISYPDARTFNLTFFYKASDNPSDTRVEKFSSLSMDPNDPRYVESMVNDVSQLVTVTVQPAAQGVADYTVVRPAETLTHGRLTSGAFGQNDLNNLPGVTHDNLQISLDGYPPDTISTSLPFMGTDLAAKLGDVADRIQAKVHELGTGAAYQNFTCALDSTKTKLVLSFSILGPGSNMQVSAAANNDIAASLHLLTGATGTLTSGAFNPTDLDALPDATHDSLQISLDGSPPDTISIKDPPGPFTGADLATKLADAAGRIQEKVRALKADAAHQGFTCAPDPTNTKLVLTSGTLGSGSKVQVSAAANNDIAAALHLLTSATSSPASNTPLTGGSEGTYSAANYGLFIGDRSLRKGIYALEGVDIFNLLCLPGVTDGGILMDAAAYCQERRAFLIVDSQSGQTPDQMNITIAGPTLPKTSYAALYYPWVSSADPLNNGKQRLCPPSGAVAGVYARTDSTRGVWKAPAGTDATLVGAQGLEYVLTDPQNGNLNPHAVNCLRVFPVYGSVVWGSRTLRGDDVIADDYKYIPIRRLALYIEESLYRSTKWVVFEPNDEPLWAQIRLNVGAFMHNLFRQGAFQGTTPNQAYFVKCDSETTTQNDRDLGIVNIVVGFAPLKPAEFVIIQIQQIAGQIQV